MVFRENIVRETERDASEFKGPPDAIAKPSDQQKLAAQLSPEVKQKWLLYTVP